MLETFAHAAPILGQGPLSSVIHAPRTGTFSLTGQAFLLYHDVYVPKNLFILQNRMQTIKTAYGEKRVGGPTPQSLGSLCNQSTEKTKRIGTSSIWLGALIVGIKHTHTASGVKCQQSVVNEGRGGSRC